MSGSGPGTRFAPPSAAAAAIASGTTLAEQSVTAPLAHLAEAAAGLDPPALVVIGEVVRLAEALAPGVQGVAAPRRTRAA